MGGLLDPGHGEARLLAVTKHFGHECFGLGGPGPAVITEMIKKVQQFALFLVEAHETFDGLRVTQSS
jgi:hypothetical protein